MLFAAGWSPFRCTETVKMCMSMRIWLWNVLVLMVLPFLRLRIIITIVVIIVIMYYLFDFMLQRFCCSSARVCLGGLVATFLSFRRIAVPPSQWRETTIPVALTAVCVRSLARSLLLGYFFCVLALVRFRFACSTTLADKYKMQNFFRFFFCVRSFAIAVCFQWKYNFVVFFYVLRFSFQYQHQHRAQHRVNVTRFISLLFFSRCVSTAMSTIVWISCDINAINGHVFVYTSLQCGTLDCWTRFRLFCELRSV